MVIYATPQQVIDILKVTTVTDDDIEFSQDQIDRVIGYYPINISTGLKLQPNNLTGGQRWYLVQVVAEVIRYQRIIGDKEYFYRPAVGGKAEGMEFEAVPQFPARGLELLYAGDLMRWTTRNTHNNWQDVGFREV